MRTELEPRISVVQERYPVIHQMILDYTEFCDKNGDEDDVEYRRLEAALHEMTGKDMSRYNLWEWWEEDGSEALAFRIGLPDAEKVDGITRDELAEIVRRIQQISKNVPMDEFARQFMWHLNDYYHQLLEINFKRYAPDYFHSQKDKNGKSFEYSSDEIVEKILG
jgi:hypothetical protein